MVSKQVQIVDSDESDGFSVSEESITELLLLFKPPIGGLKRRNPSLKRAAGKVTRQPSKKQNLRQTRYLNNSKTFLCQWSGNEYCMRKNPGGTKDGFCSRFI